MKESIVSATNYLQISIMPYANKPRTIYSRK